MNYENDAALGISATETTRNAKANELYGTSFNKLDEAQKQLTLLALVEDGNRLSGALGQAALESDGLENVLGNLRQAFTNLQAQLGNLILEPVIAGIQALTGVLNNINVQDVINKFRNLASETTSQSNLIQNVISTLKNGVEAVVTALFDTVVPFFQQQLKRITEFWKQNGDQILKAVTVAFNAVKAVFDFVLPAILAVVRFVWGAIQNVISGAIGVIQGVIKVFSSVLTGDWQGLWDGIKSILSGAVQLIIGVLNLTFVGGIRTLFVNLARNLLTIIRNNWTSILGVFRSFGSNITGVVTNLISSVLGFFRNFATQGVANFNTLRTLGANAVSALRQSVVNTAGNLVRGFLNALNGLRTQAVSTIRNVSTGIINTIKNLPSQFVTVGKQMIQGLINGIKSLNPIAAVSGIAKGMVDRVKSIFDINSPSRVFTQIGEFVSQGLAIGINNFKDLPIENIKEIADRVVREGAEAAAKAGSVIEQVSESVRTAAVKVNQELNKELDSIERKASNDVLKLRKETNKKISDLKRTNAENDKKITQKLNSDIAKLEKNEASRKKKDATKLASDIAKLKKDADSKIRESETKLVRDIAKINTNANANAKRIQDKANQDSLKSQQKAQSEIIKLQNNLQEDRLKALNEYANAQKESGDFSITQEIEFWRAAVKTFEDGSKQQTEARKKYNNAIAEYNKQLIDNTKNYISEQRDLNNISVIDEIDLWQSVLNQLEVGSKEYLDARKNFREALKAANDATVKINEDFASQIKTINDNLIKNEQDLNKAYEDAYEKRFSDLLNSTGLFDEFNSKVEKSGFELLQNLQSQVKGLDDFDKNIKKLENRGIGGDLLSELTQLGPKALPQLIALNQLTDQQLAQYQSIYEERAIKARERTEKELTDLRLNTQSQIEQLRNDAIIELGKLETEWQSQILAITQVTQDGLSSTRQIGVDAATNLLNGLTSLEPSLVTKAKEIAAAVNLALQSALNLPSNLESGLNVTSNATNPLRGTALNLGEIGGIVDRVTSGSGAVNTNNSKTQVNNVTVYTNEADIEIERVNRRLSFGF